MRVISGVLGGRVFQSPKSNHTHPMSEKARGAIFNALGDINDLSFLDAYAGSGALSIEAISRGAKSGIAIDSDVMAWKTIVANLDVLNIAKAVHAVKAPVTSWSSEHSEEQFDLVFADPPYDAIKIDALTMLTCHVLEGGIFVLSWPGGENIPKFVGLEQVAHKSLGDIQLIFYRR